MKIIFSTWFMEKGVFGLSIIKREAICFKPLSNFLQLLINQIKQRF